MLEVRMQLDLVNGRTCFGGLQHRLKVPTQKIGDTNRLGLARCRNLLHLSPFLLQFRLVSVGEERLVNEIEVDVVEAEFLQAGIDGARNILDIGGDLGCDEELLSRGFGLRDGLSQLLLGAVDFGTV